MTRSHRTATRLLAALVLVAGLVVVRSGRGGEGGQEAGCCRGATVEETGQVGECVDGVVCGEGCCPSEAYTCCAEESEAPPECCLSDAYTCYTGGGALTGWPRYNGCNPTEQGCGGDKPLFCAGSRRNTCCPSDHECGSYFGVAYCRDPACPDDRSCNKGRLCCTRPGICRDFLNVQYCHEDCAALGRQTCALEGDHYGDEPFHLCCPAGTCRHHPDGWPFCEGVVD